MTVSAFMLFRLIMKSDTGQLTHMQPHICTWEKRERSYLNILQIVFGFSLCLFLDLVSKSTSPSQGTGKADDL